MDLVRYKERPYKEITTFSRGNSNAVYSVLEGFDNSPRFAVDKRDTIFITQLTPEGHTNSGNAHFEFSKKFAEIKDQMNMPRRMQELINKNPERIKIGCSEFAIGQWVTNDYLFTGEVVGYDHIAGRVICRSATAKNEQDRVRYSYDVADLRKIDVPQTFHSDGFYRLYDRFDLSSSFVLARMFVNPMTGLTKVYTATGEPGSRLFAEVYGAQNEIIPEVLNGKVLVRVK